MLIFTSETHYISFFYVILEFVYKGIFFSMVFWIIKIKFQKYSKLQQIYFVSSSLYLKFIL